MTPRTMEMNGGSSVPHLACTPCVPLFVHCLIRVEAEGLLDYCRKLFEILFHGFYIRIIPQHVSGHVRDTCMNSWELTNANFTCWLHVENVSELIM